MMARDYVVAYVRGVTNIAVECQGVDMHRQLLVREAAVANALCIWCV